MDCLLGSVGWKSITVALDARCVVLRCLNLTLKFESGINFFGLTVWEIGGLAYLILEQTYWVEVCNPSCAAYETFVTPEPISRSLHYLPERQFILQQGLEAKNQFEARDDVMRSWYESRN